ncbi:MAG: hypothetical protein ACRDS0_31540 [Pseudonocardiaceae bacterium]
MNTTTALKKTSEHGGPVVLGAGVAMLAVALATGGHSRSEATGPAPTATVTVTRTQVPASVHRSPHPSSASAAPQATILAASEPTEALPRTGSGSQSHTQARPPSTPQPSPAAVPCGSGVLSVRLLQACVSLGR